MLTEYERTILVNILENELNSAGWTNDKERITELANLIAKLEDMEVSK